MPGPENRLPNWAVPALIIVAGLVLGYLTSLVGYIVLLALGKPTGTLDNLVSLSIGAVAGGTVVGGGMTAVNNRRQTDPPEPALEPPAPDVAALIAGHDAVTPPEPPPGPPPFLPPPFTH